MKNHLVAVGVVAVLLSPILNAQEIPVLSGPYGNLVVPDVITGTGPVTQGLRTEEKTLNAKFTPSYVYADGTDVLGGTLAKSFIQQNQSVFTVDARYLNISPESASNLDEWRFRGIYTFPSSSPRFTGSAIAEYKTLESTHDQVSLLASGTYALTDRVLGTVNAGWSDRDYDVGQSVNDVTAGIGLLGLVTDSFKVSLDYQLKNDIAKEDNYSLTFLVGKSLAVGFAKNDTYYLSYSLAF